MGRPNDDHSVHLLHVTKMTADVECGAESKGSGVACKTKVQEEVERGKTW